MEGCHIKAKDKTGDAGNAKSQSRVRGNIRHVVDRGNLVDRADARSRWESRPRSLVSAALRRQPSLIHSKAARPALKVTVEGERSEAILKDRQFLGPQAGLPVDKARASKGKRLFDINQGSNSFCGVLEVESSGVEVQHTEKSNPKRRPFRIYQVGNLSRATTKLGVEGQLVASNNSKAFEVLEVESSSDEEVEKEERPNFEIYEESSDDDGDVVYVEQRSNANGGSSTAKLGGARSDPGGEMEVGEVRQTEKLSVTTDKENSDERDVVFVEHISNANVCSNSNRETTAAKLRRDVSLQCGKETGKVVGRQTGGLPVAVNKTEKRLEIEQWQAWITLQQQAWKEADEREQGTPLREADQKWLKSYNKKMRKDLAKKKKHC